LDTGLPLRRRGDPRLVPSAALLKVGYRPLVVGTAGQGPQLFSLRRRTRLRSRPVRRERSAHRGYVTASRMPRVRRCRARSRTCSARLAAFRTWRPIPGIRRSGRLVHDSRALRRTRNRGRTGCEDIPLQSLALVQRRSSGGPAPTTAVEAACLNPKGWGCPACWSYCRCDGRRSRGLRPLVARAADAIRRWQTLPAVLQTQHPTAHPA
jgi:hypothetical protein